MVDQLTSTFNKYEISIRSCAGSNQKSKTSKQEMSNDTYAPLLFFSLEKGD